MRLVRGTALLLALSVLLAGCGGSRPTRTTIGAGLGALAGAGAGALLGPIGVTAGALVGAGIGAGAGYAGS